jgi:uncharacterized protein (TIGR03032 family)
MGMTRTPTGLAVGAKRQIWFLDGVVEVAPKVTPAGTFDVTFLTRRSHVTGPIMGHEMAWGQNELWVANTGFSCLCTIDQKHNFVPRWKPPFVSKLVGEDRCHLNGLAMDGNEPRLVSVLGQSDTAGGWRANKAAGGVLIHVDSAEIITRGLSMPHSPRLQDGRVWLLNSGTGELGFLDRAAGKFTAVAFCPGYARGLAFIGSYAIVGLSLARENRTFQGLPLDQALASRGAEPRCGLLVVDTRTGDTVEWLRIEGVVRELFDVAVLPGIRNPAAIGFVTDEIQRIISIEEADEESIAR